MGRASTYLHCSSRARAPLATQHPSTTHALSFPIFRAAHQGAPRCCLHRLDNNAPNHVPMRVQPHRPPASTAAKTRAQPDPPASKACFESSSAPPRAPEKMATILPKRHSRRKRSSMQCFPHPETSRGPAKAHAEPFSCSFPHPPSGLPGERQE